ncbi:RagB/SusD family nutrient uptake outer membrane protein [Chitinophaga pinensis]|uniref:RagB/SusD family nutrient uptake outer membrane protein n=1 Tax=Chitinophaga pinensis TaxID=79329 RepID=A0A5C6LJX6_9BACT|nr:RagB/SusD family nutrient uptake outer membrane protein [Chitinophaga pinensis]TWV95075.1 RagB/SusD family nutrient uptake outer membrane protein [Chitinophaga pinensis]
MKRMCFLLPLLTVLTSCVNFLDEQPSGSLGLDDYYKTAEQIKAAVNGTYEGLSLPYAENIGVAVSPVYSLEYITGYSRRPRPSGFEDDQFLRLDRLDAANSRLQAWWNATYYPVENCNSVIENVSVSTLIDDATKQRYLGQAYFMRAWYYFQGVQLFGDIPLKLTTTKDPNDVKIRRSPKEAIYDQIVKDLIKAENSGLPWTDQSGHVSLGTVKSLLAKVYLTMAGYPMQRGITYYSKAYDKALEVINSRQFTLFESYKDLRDPAKMNTGENIFMLQRHPTMAESNIHGAYLPYPTEPISIQPAYGGAMAPTQAFYNSYAADDGRKQEQAFYYTRYPRYDHPTEIITFSEPYIFKFWDADAEKTGRSGANFPLIRYADVLLLCAEAKSQLDGGSTRDGAAIAAYYAVRQRAFPTAVRPTILTTDDILKERYWELCFEFQTWYDMLRTRKAFDVANGTMTNLSGYKAPNHLRAFELKDLTFPLPLAEVQKNPDLAL